MTKATRSAASAQPKRLGARITDALDELHEALLSGRPLHERFRVNTVEIAEPRRYGPAAVSQTRKRLGASQAVFAKMMGVSAELVEHWEQGVRKPRPIACRLLDQINENPAEFLKRMVQRYGSSPARTKVRKAG